MMNKTTLTNSLSRDYSLEKLAPKIKNLILESVSSPNLQSQNKSEPLNSNNIQNLFENLHSKIDVTSPSGDNGRASIPNADSSSSLGNDISQVSFLTKRTITRILVIYTGGTVGMRKSKQGYVPSPGFLSSQLAKMDAFQVQSPEMLKDLENHKIFTTPLSDRGKTGRYRIVEYNPIIDSSNMNYKNWNEIAGDVKKYYQDYDSFLILHGTDTMAYTTSALSLMFTNLSKTIIVTGSQIPISQSRNDAYNNLLGALTICMHYDIPEVCLYFNNKLLRGNRATKVDASGLDAFQSLNYPPLVEVGTSIKVRWRNIRQNPIYFRLCLAGKKNHLSNEKLTLRLPKFEGELEEDEEFLMEGNAKTKKSKLPNSNPNSPTTLSPNVSIFPSPSGDNLNILVNGQQADTNGQQEKELRRRIPELDVIFVKYPYPNIAIVRLFPGIPDELIEKMLSFPTEGAVLLTYGSGNAPDDRESFLSVIKRAKKRGVVMVNITQCHRGYVAPSYSTGIKLMEAGVVPGYDMTVEAAVCKLVCLLSVMKKEGSSENGMQTSGQQQESTQEGGNVRFKYTIEEVKSLLQKNIRGELTQIPASFKKIKEREQHDAENKKSGPEDKTTTNDSAEKSAGKSSGSAKSNKTNEKDENTGNSDKKTKKPPIKTLIDSLLEGQNTDNKTSSLSTPPVASSTQNSSWLANKNSNKKIKDIKLSLEKYLNEFSVHDQPFVKMLTEICFLRPKRDTIYGLRASLVPLTVLTLASLGKEQELNTLLEEGAGITCINPNIADTDNRTCLHVAATNGHLGVCKILFKYGASIAIKDQYGNTPLDDAIRENKLDVVEWMLSKIDIDEKFFTQYGNYFENQSNGSILQRVLQTRGYGNASVFNNINSNTLIVAGAAVAGVSFALFGYFYSEKRKKQQEN